MSAQRPKSYIKTLTANTITNFAEVGAVDQVFSAAILIQNNTGSEMLVGGVEGPTHKVPAGAEYEWSGIDVDLGGGSSLTSTSDIYVLSPLGGEVSITVSVKR